jgi:hypothetical protein
VKLQVLEPLKARQLERVPGAVERAAINYQNLLRTLGFAHQVLDSTADTGQARHLRLPRAGEFPRNVVSQLAGIRAA